MIPSEQVRSFRTSTLVDTGAVMNMLPRDVIEHLGVPLRGTAIVTLVDERKEELPVAASTAAGSQSVIAHLSALQDEVMR